MARIGAMTETERHESLLRLSGYLHTWSAALDQQAARLSERSVMTAGPDAWLYALALLGAALRCVRLAGDLGIGVDAALETFHGAVPDAKRVRDVLEHLEDYELGIGDLQKPDQRRRLDFLYSSSDKGIEFIELQGVDVRLELRTAHDAARALLEQVAEAVMGRRSEA
jgi:hypothetical protein